MAKNCAVKSIILPCFTCIDVRNMNNWIYDLTAREPGHSAPTNIPAHDNESVPTDDEYDHMEHDPPGISEPVTCAYIIPDPSNTFVCTSSGHQSQEEYDYVAIRITLDDVLYELRHCNDIDAKRNQLFRNM